MSPVIIIFFLFSSTTSSGSSHSAFSSMSTIDQVNPTRQGLSSSSSGSRYTSHHSSSVPVSHSTDLFDEYGVDEPPSSR